MSNYSKGRKREYDVMDILKKAGYQCLRTAGSHGMWDVIAIGPSNIRLIQVKLNRTPTPAERRAIEEFRVAPRTTKEVWMFRTGARKPIAVKTYGGDNGNDKRSTGESGADTADAA